MSRPTLPPPHGGVDVDLRVDVGRADELRAASRDWPSWDLTAVQLADLELLATGAYAPLRGFATAQDTASVLTSLRLPDGTLWPVPITLDVDEPTAAAVAEGGHLALRDPEGTMLGVLTVSSRWRPDPEAEARALLGTTDPARPEVRALLARTGPVRLGGQIEAVELPTHHDLPDVRATPAEVADRLGSRGWPATLALHLRGVPDMPLLHRVAREAVQHDAGVLLHPTVGPCEAGDLDRFTRLRVARLAAARLADLGVEVELAATPLPARLLGARETVLQAIVEQNHGASHLLVGPGASMSHAPGPAPDPAGPAPDPADAGAGQRLLVDTGDDLAITPVPIPRQVHVPSTGGPASLDDLDPDTEVVDLTEARLHAALAADEPLDGAAIAPEVITELRRTYPPRHQRGFTVFLTGLSGSGKSTVANVLSTRLLEAGGRTVTLLDGDLVRKHLSSELGFSKEHRDLNVLRIGYVASEITKHRGIAICAPIAPYDDIRKANRAAIEATGGGYVVVHVATPLEVCEARDRKGLYAKARAGLITGFTGIDDPYEVPDDAAVTLDTTDLEPADAAQRIVAHLEAEGWWPPRD